MENYIVKHLMKKDRHLTKQEAIEKAKIIEKNYSLQNTEQNKKNTKDQERRLKKSLDWEFFNLALDYFEQTGESPYIDDKKN